MSAFARHGIDHLSPSSLNLWRDNPGIWALCYLKRVKDAGGATLWRGTAVEQGLSALLRGASIPDACNVAELNFLTNSQGELFDDEQSLISPMVQQCAKWTPPPGDLNASQLRVEYWFDEIPVPVIGYVDFAFDGIDVELKTTKACPSTPRPDHVRQVSLYRAARDRAGGLLYVTAKKHAWFEVDDEAMNGALADMHNDAVSLHKFLGKFTTADEAVECLPMDQNHFRFPKPVVPLDQLVLV